MEVDRAPIRAISRVLPRPEGARLCAPNHAPRRPRSPPAVPLVFEPCPKTLY
jgi:hypothetical protein